jgi:broad specificity phosphatase PhoE
MPPSIILVRHAMSAVDPRVDSRDWGITPAAREQCCELARCLPLATAIWTSRERKALETAEILAGELGAPVRIDERFGEVLRPGVWDRDYRGMASGYLAGARFDGWEEATAVRERFAAGIAAAAPAGGGTGDIVVVDHGLALTLFLAAKGPVIERSGNRMRFEPVPFWSALTFPDAWRFDPGSNAVTRIFEGGLIP